jgi:NAD+ synthase (glutamine-hydrolysing)
MKLIKVASGVVNQTPMDWKNNLNNCIQVVEAAKKEQVSILCLPELALSGYGCEDAFYSPDLRRHAWSALMQLKEYTEDIIVCVGLPVEYNQKLFNAACLIVNKQIVGFSCKQHLPNYSLFYEDRWFHRWPAGKKSDILINGQCYPFGDLTYEVDGIKIGIEICEDAWVPDRPANGQYARGADIILNPSASPFEFFKFQTRERLIVESSRAYACTYVYSNLLGNEAGRLIFDGDAQIASNGELIVSSSRFSYADFTLTTAVVDTDLTGIDHTKVKSGVAIPDTNQVRHYFEFPDDIKPVIQTPVLEPFEKGGWLKEEEFSRAVCLGLFDYLRKSKSQGFTVSLSGGADSSACVALCGLMIRLADESIGLAELKKKLGYIAKIQQATTEEEIAGQIIHSIYQATKNSSDSTRESARELARSIGAHFYEIDIDGLVEQYTNLIETQIGRKLSWNTDDVSLQNIQARVRAPGAWLLTNLTGHLLLATSNRSEVAVGYATMDGDTSGSISPLAGIDKHWLRHWLVWLEKNGCEVKGRHIKIDGLKYVNALAPTAELRPKEFKQTDEKDLMPYEVLDFIERQAVKDKKSPAEAFRYAEVYFEGKFDRESVYVWIKKFYRLWSINQWKRERYAPSFHLDNRNLDPRSWCRFPILNGGFEEELEELTAYFEGKPSFKKKGIGFRLNS